jgi:hypothetical protein
MNNQLAKILGDRPDATAILEALSINPDNTPEKRVLEALRKCVELMGSGVGLAEAAKQVLSETQPKSERKHPELIEQTTGAIAVANPTAPSTAAIQIPQSSQDSVEEVAKALAAHGVGDITHTMVKAAVEVADEIDVVAKGALYKAIFSEENKPNVEKALELFRQMRGEQ